MAELSSGRTASVRVDHGPLLVGELNPDTILKHSAPASGASCATRGSVEVVSSRPGAAKDSVYRRIDALGCPARKTSRPRTPNSFQEDGRERDEGPMARGR